MKVLFLNVWHGKLRETLRTFLQTESSTTDVFCFQEAYEETRLIFDETLIGYAMFTGYKYIDDHDDFPQLLYVRKTLNTISHGILFEREMDVGLGLYVQMRIHDQDIWICNFHGVSRPIDKLDSPGRLSQSLRLIEFFKDKNGVKVIGGDFNTFPETKNIFLFEEHGYRNLIKEFSIKTTRNRFVWERYPDSKQYYSDYVFTNSGIRLKDFSVPNIEVSDHLPLIVDIEI